MELYLKTLHMNNPLGIDVCPYFSWIITNESQNVLQTAYQIVVKDDNTTVWDSGKVTSDTSTYVLYGGKELESRTTYSWNLTVWDNQGNVATKSATFETAMLQKNNWQAKWAEAALPHVEWKKEFGNQPPAVMFRKDFLLKSKVKRARLYATCHGTYQLTVNGVRPDDREFAPEHTSYEKYLCYQTYDITGMVQTGKNTLGMYVGDGWYNSPFTKPNIKNFKPHHAVLFQLEIEYTNGKKEMVLSDEQVKTATGAVLYSNLFFGEKYDANLEIKGWDTPAYNADGWKFATISNYGYANLVAQLGEPVRPVATLPVKTVYQSPKGETIIDFGQVLSGRVRMKVNAPKGTVIRLDHFEVVDKDGNYYNNLGGNNVDQEKSKKTPQQRIDYIAKGDTCIYEPHFTFHGFRYIRVSGYPEPLPEYFTAVALSTEMENMGTFECSDPRLNRLYENTRWSQRSNMLSIPTDCPQREKAGWTGDIQVYATTALHNADATMLLTRWLSNLALDQSETGAVPMVVPYEGNYLFLNNAAGKLFGNKKSGINGQAGWGDAAVLVPYAMYQATGNTAILRQQYDSMKQWCKYVIDTAQKQHGKNKLPKDIDQYLWNTGFHWGEWLIPSQSRNGIGLDAIRAVKASRSYVAPIFSYFSISSMAETAHILGNRKDEDFYRDYSEKIKDAFIKGLIRENGDMPVEYMGAYVLPIYFDLVPEKHKQHFAQKLVSMIEKNGNCLDTGFLATPYILDALCKVGRRDVAYRLLYQENCPSWLYEVKMGATSIWESWFSYTEDGSPMQTSYNHYAFGCVDDWMFRTICGINKTLPGYKHIVIQPQPDDSLTYAKRIFTSSYGDIVCNWERKDGMFYMETTIPCNTTATIVLPDGSTYEVGSGTYTFTSK